jgi:S-DNA-T family DNA segregation ATPase FtsK/SpoIIIE
MKKIQTLSDRDFNRAPRVRPPLPSGEIEIPTPPAMPQAPSTSWWSILLPILGIGIFMGITITANENTNPALMLGSGAMMLASVGASLVNHLQQRKKYQMDLNERRSAYNQAIKKVKKELVDAHQAQKDALLRMDPDPEDCLSQVLNLDVGLWERRPQDDDFISLRIGIGETPLSLNIKHHKPPAVIPQGQDAKLHQQAVDLGNTYAMVPDVPITTHLAEVGILGVAGPPPIQHALLRGMLSSLVTQHSPDEVKLVAFLPYEQREEWAWLRWFPHVHTQVGGLSRWIATTQQEVKHLTALLGQEWGRRKLQMDYIHQKKELPLPRYILLIADQTVLNEAAISQVLAEGISFGAYMIIMGPDRPHLPKQCGAVVEIDLSGTAKYTLVGKDAPPVPFNPDRPDLDVVERLSRALAPIQPTKEVTADALPNAIRTLELYQARRVEELPIWENWQRNKIYEKVEAPIGVRVGGHPMVLNLWENIHGPHGLLAGATRSGKSELLKTLVSTLAIQYHPHDLVFVLIDFKGGGLIRDIDKLPHVVGTATNLEEGLPERALEAIKAELIRREAILQGRHIRDYQKDYHAGKINEPLPRMIVIIDEFAELATEKPDVLDSLVSAARVGGSLGVNLILATQKPAGVVKGQIWSNSRFRICLRVETAEDSQDMLHRPDAAAIDRPGRGYLQVGENEVYELIQVARAEATYVTGEAVVSDEATISYVRIDGRRELLYPPADPDATTILQTQDTTDLQAIVQYIQQIAEGHGIQRMPGPWLAMLPERVDLNHIRSLCNVGGWDGQEWQSTHHWLNPLVGLIDDTARQEQPAISIDLGNQGHLYLCGGTGSGKTVFLRTLIASLVQDHTPDEVNLYLLDYGGRGLDAFETLPHVGAVLHPGDEEVVERLFLWLLEEVDRRNDLLGDAPTLAAYRKRKDAEWLPALILIVDSYATLAESFEDAPDYVQKLARSGQGAGIHLIVAADRVGALSTRAATNFNLRMALYLPERSDYSLVVSKSPHFSLQQIPGRGVWMGETLLECQIAALPEDYGVSGGSQSLQEMVAKMEQNWEGRKAHPMRELPKELYLNQILKDWKQPEIQEQKDSLAAVVGLDSLRLEPVVLDFGQMGPHFLVAGQSQSGKTTALKTVLTSLAASYPPESLQFWLVDCFKPGLNALKELPHTRSYAAEGRIMNLVSEICGLLESSHQRVEEDARAKIILAMDDYDFLEDSSIKDQLYSWTRRARVIGFHLLLAGAVSELRSGFDELRRQVLTSRCGLLLSSATEDAQVFNIRLPMGSGAFPPGRGYLVNRGQPVLVQWALPFNNLSKLTRN